LSVAVGAVAVFNPTVPVSSVTEPLAAVARPDSPSLAVQGALALLPRITVSGQVIETSGGSASTSTEPVTSGETLPAASVAAPL